MKVKVKYGNMWFYWSVNGKKVFDIVMSYDYHYFVVGMFALWDDSCREAVIYVR